MPFPYSDLREFIAELEARNLLARVSVQVDSDLEITAITDRVVKSSGSALLFENVKDSSLPVAINLFGTEERMKLALGVDDYSLISSRIEELIQPEMPTNLLGKVKKLPQLMKFAGFIPKEVRSGDCQEVVLRDNFSLNDFPVLKCWPGDAGRYITMGLTICKNPSTGQRNAGIYRLQIFDANHTGMHIHPFHDGAVILREYAKRGEKMPVAVAIGVDPAVIYAASSPLPPGIDEFIFAGFLRDAPVELVKCKTVDIEVPATAEIVLEGYVDPNTVRIEGPFGDHTGFYSPAGEFPVFEITCITHRKNPVYHSIVVGKPPMEDTYLGWATERIFLPLVRSILPEIVDYHMPGFGVFHNWIVVSIDKSYAHQARKVACGLWGLGQMMLSKFILVVDKDVNVHNTDEVMFHLASNIDPERDTFTVKGPIDILDHASSVCGTGSKMCIDATKKISQEGYHRNWPAEIRMDEEILHKIRDRWNEYGIG